MKGRQGKEASSFLKKRTKKLLPFESRFVELSSHQHRKVFCLFFLKKEALAFLLLPVRV
jgi:hypothetical protein